MSLDLGSACDLHISIVFLNSLGSNITTTPFLYLLVFLPCLIRGDVPWLFAQLFRHPANPPVRTTDDEHVPDGSIAEEWSQSHYSDPDSLMVVLP